VEAAAGALKAAFGDRPRAALREGNVADVDRYHQHIQYWTPIGPARKPVAALYEQNKVRHAGAFTDLEDQACAMTGAGYLGDGSPDRVDALVWALSELMLQAVTPTAQFGVWGSYVAPPAKSKFDGLIEEGPLSGGFAVSR